MGQNRWPYAEGESERISHCLTAGARRSRRLLKRGTSEQNKNICLPSSGSLCMAEIAAGLHFALFVAASGVGNKEVQLLSPDPIPSCACARGGDAQSDPARDAPRDATGRFAKGYSGNPKGRPRRHSQPTPPPARPAAAAGAARHPGPARPAQALSAAAGAAASAAAGPPARPRRAARHRFLPHGFGAGDRRGDRQSVRGDRPRRDRAERGPAPCAAGAQAAARDPPLAVVAPRPPGGDAPRREARGQIPSLLKRQKFPVLREFRRRPRLLDRRARGLQNRHRLRMPGCRCFPQPESSRINRLLLMFCRPARARAKGPAGRDRFTSPGARVIVGAFRASVSE
jgi:hypothetical protein